MPRRPLVFLFARPWLLLSISLGIAASCTSIYCAMGSLRYEHRAQNERLAAERAERTNIDLQDALDRLRTELAEMQNGTGEATRYGRGYAGDRFYTEDGLDCSVDRGATSAGRACN